MPGDQVVDAKLEAVAANATDNIDMVADRDLVLHIEGSGVGVCPDRPVTGVGGGAQRDRRHRDPVGQPHKNSPAPVDHVTACEEAIDPLVARALIANFKAGEQHVADGSGCDRPDEVVLVEQVLARRGIAIGFEADALDAAAQGDRGHREGIPIELVIIAVQDPACQGQVVAEPMLDAPAQDLGLEVADVEARNTEEGVAVAGEGA